MMSSELSIEMLPARHGDALWIEWGTDTRHRMLIDGGPHATYDLLSERFARLPEGERHVDLLVITHVDLDHIDGAIRLLHDRDRLGVTYGDIWFNDHRHLTDEPTTRGAMQGEYLAAVIEHIGLPWNNAFRGATVVVPAAGSLPSVTLPGGLRLVLVSPTPDTLLKLHAKWESTVEQAGLEPGDREEALERVEGRLGPLERGRALFGGDHSPANGSSIAFVAEYGVERWLLAGDAHDDVLLAGLQRYGAAIGEERVRLDGFKVPHHGSANNISPELLDAIDCRRFLISTDGSYFGHPDERCIDLLVQRSDRPELIFNYRSEHNAKWSEPSPDYRAVYPGDSDAGHRGAIEAVEVVNVTSDAAPVPSGAPEPEPDDRHPRSDGPPIEVTVCHGSLEVADHPVLVGHYVGTPMSGTEAFIDRRFHGRLSDRLDRGTYPDEVGRSLYLEAPPRRHPASGVMIVGLGEYGELTPLRLVETVRTALVRHALDVRDRAGGDVAQELGISSVLLGATGDQGVSIAAAVRSLVAAVREANRALQADAGGTGIRYATLQIWERYESNAELAFRSLRAIADDQMVDADNQGLCEIRASPDLGVEAGALENVPLLNSDEGSWWRLRIVRRADGPAVDPAYVDLDFSVGGRLARTGNVVHRVERRRLDRLLRAAVTKTHDVVGIQTTLFELLFPNQLKWDLMAAQDIQLEVDDTTADIPWEMLAARNPRATTRGQLALRAPIVRQLRLPDLPSVQRASRSCALVIGNPPAGGRFQPLPGAHAEATTVVSVLRGGERYDVTSLCFDQHARPDAETTQSIETALFDDDYRIVHIAGHGLFQPDDPSRTGVVIGPDDFLTARVFGQLNVVPDLVFLNCCHLGNIEEGFDSGAVEFTREHLNRLGASLARQLIDSGVRAVVVAGWAVEDKAAAAFAETFYAAMLGGVAFGAASYQARLRARAESPTHNTWGAYQCYGDAGYRLPNDRQRSRMRPAVEPVTVAEAIRRLQALVSKIEFVGIEADANGPERTWAIAERDQIVATARERGWTVDIGGDTLKQQMKQQLCAQLGAVGAALGDHDQAVEWYTQVLGAQKTSMSLAALEELANQQDRLAAKIRREADVTDERLARVQPLLDDAGRMIGILESLSPSGERAALRAGHQKRRAAASAPGSDERAVALRAAADSYLRAYETDQKMYGLLNYIQLEQIRGRTDGDTPRTEQHRERLREIVNADAPGVSADYWARVERADAVLTQAIVDDDVPGTADRLVELYDEAFDSRSKGGQRASTLTHLRDLADVHPTPAQAAALGDVHRRLDRATSPPPAES